MGNVALKDMLKTLRESSDKAYVEFKKFDNAIKALQGACDHIWHYKGHGHNDSLYECEVCGKEKTI